MLVGSRAETDTGRPAPASPLLADDWPRRLYEKLGFETTGRYARFLKRLQ